MKNDIYLAKKLTKKFGERFKQNVLLKNHTTIKIGGPAKFFVEIKNLNELKMVKKLAKKTKKKTFVLGGGSNVLAKDEGFSGIIISTKRLNTLKFAKSTVFAGAGVNLGKLVLACKNKQLSGLEWAVGIPGTVGGAVFMNAGAFGSEILDTLKSVIFFDGKRLRKQNPAKLNFAYRQSAFQNNPSHVIFGAEFSLQIKSLSQIQKMLLFFTQKRKQTQNVRFPSAGSVFKRTKIAPASQLIDMAGLKGKTEKGAMVSPVHAGFVVNFCNATCKDVENLVDFISISVYNKFSEKLELEIKVLED